MAARTSTPNIASASRETSGTLAGRTNMSPRVTSISAASVSVIESPADADSKRPSMVTMLATLDRCREGNTTISSPTCTPPDAIVPLNPRNSASGRFTNWTGNRKSVRFWSPPMYIDSRMCSNDPSEYQSVLLLGWTTLSPPSAESGNESDIGDVEFLRKSSKVGADLLENLLLKIHQVHLVDGQDDMLNA